MNKLSAFFQRQADKIATRLSESTDDERVSLKKIVKLSKEISRATLNSDNALEFLVRARDIKEPTDFGVKVLEDLFKIDKPLYTLLNNKRTENYQSITETFKAQYPEKGTEINAMDTIACRARCNQIIEDLRGVKKNTKAENHAVAELFMLGQRVEQLYHSPKTPKEDKQQIKSVFGPLGAYNGTLVQYDRKMKLNELKDSIENVKGRATVVEIDVEAAMSGPKPK